MCQERIIAESNIYFDSHYLIQDTTVKNKKLDITKLRILLTDLGFNPTSKGTNYIIEELKYLIENKNRKIGTLKEMFSISSQFHNIKIKNIQWDIEYCIDVMKKNANKDLIHSVLYWNDKIENLYPRYILFGILDYLNENFDKYKK